MSNNSVVLRADQDYEDFSYIPDMAKRIVDNGEPGMINLYNIQKYARYGKEKHDDATLVNPCGEISLENFELCNLAEVFPPRCKNKTDFYKALKFATFYASTVSLLPTHRPETNAIIAKNRRIGVSISGIAQWASGQCLVEPHEWGEMNYTKMTTYLRQGYKIVKEYNAEFAKMAGVPAAVRVTTVKPSGSISLLAGVTPGVHYPVSRYAIRRMRIGKDSPLVPSLVEAGIPHEDDTYSDNTLVFSFAIDHGDVRPCEQVSPWGTVLRCGNAPKGATLITASQQQFTLTRKRMRQTWRRCLPCIFQSSSRLVCFLTRVMDTPKPHTNLLTKKSISPSRIPTLYQSLIRCLGMSQ